MAKQFLDLPAELRNRISQLVLFNSCGTCGVDNTQAMDLRSVPAICRVNQLLRSETLPIFRASNKFIIRTNQIMEGGDLFTAVRNSDWKLIQNLEWINVWENPDGSSRNISAVVKTTPSGCTLEIRTSAIGSKEWKFRAGTMSVENYALHQANVMIGALKILFDRTLVVTHSAIVLEIPFPTAAS